MIEAIEAVARLSGCRLRSSYWDKARIGDRICYISNVTKLRTHFPDWEISIGLEQMLTEIIDGQRSR